VLYEVLAHRDSVCGQCACVLCCRWLTVCLCLTACLLQGVQLKSLAVYFDCDKPLMDPGHRWDLITASRWDELMLPANQISRTTQQQQQQVAAPAAAWVAGAPGKPPEPQPPQHQFLLCPVDGTLRYVRRGRAARKSESDAEQEIHLQLVQIGVQLHQLQYQSSQKLLQEFDRYAASAPHRHLRPHCRPNSGRAATVGLGCQLTRRTVAEQSVC
jgi:hypothetical protein